MNSSVEYSSSASTIDPENDQPLVELRDLTLRFAGQTILDRINLSIPKGQTLVIIGESGCGKTMLLKTVVGLIKPSEGEVLYDGQNIDQLNTKQMTALRRKFGFVFQNAALFDSMSVGDNDPFPLVQHGLASGNKLKRIVSDGLADVGLPDNVASKRPAELSGGMRKRVGLARALVLSPELVLYDEPTTGLDPIMSDVINELILNTRKKKRVTSLVITHDMRTAHKVADRVVMLYPFARLKRGEPQILYDGPAKAMESAEDRRVTQFVRGEAGERLMELRRSEIGGFDETPDVSQYYGRRAD